MDFKDSKSLKEFDNDNLYDALCKGLNHPDDISHLKDLFKDTTTLHYHLFDDVEEEGAETRRLWVGLIYN